MKKSIIAGIAMIFMLALPAQAENINGVEFEIPDNWTLVNQTEENDAVMNYYTYEEEIFTICVHNPGDAVIKTDVGDLFLLDVADAFSEYDGFYLMTDERTKNADGHSTLFQEFVYKNNDWYYCVSGSRNKGDYIVTLAYQKQTTALQQDYYNFLVLFNDHILE